jgi:hypothetical protein
MEKIKSAKQITKELADIFGLKDEKDIDCLQGKLMLWGISIADFAKDKPISCIHDLMFKN